MDNNTKMNISYVIRAIDRFTTTHEKWERQINKIERKIKDIPDEKNTKVDANTKKAEKALDRIRRKARSIPRFIFMEVGVKGYKNFRRRMDRIADFSRDVGEILAGMGFGAVFTALAPTLEVVAGGLGAIASAATAAGLGFGGFLAVAIPGLVDLGDKYDDLRKAREKLAEAATEEEMAKALEEVEQAMSKFSKKQLEAVDAMDKFGKFYSEFSSKFEEPILDMFIQSLGITQKLLEILEPAIAGVTDAVQNLMDAFERNLEADDMKEFFDWVGETAGPNFEKLTKALGNFIAGFANMMLAFDPLAQGFLDGFLDMSERFRDWTAALEDNEAFQDFVATVQEYTPLVLDLIGNLIQTLWNIIDAMTPFAGKVIEVANSFFEWFNNMMETNETFKDLVGWIFTFIGVLSMVFAPIGLLISFIWAGVGPALTAFFKWVGKLVSKLKGPFSKTILKAGARLIGFGTPVGIVIELIIGLVAVIIANWSKVWDFTKKIWGRIEGWITEQVEKAVMVGSVIAAFVGRVRDHFADLRDKVRDHMKKFVEFVKDPVKHIRDWLRGIDLSGIGRNMIRGLINGIGSMASSLVRKAKNVVGSAISAAKNLLKIKSPSRVFHEIGVFTGQGFIEGMERMESRVAKASASMSRNAIPAGVPQYRGVNVAAAPNYGFRRNPEPVDQETKLGDGGRRITIEVPLYINGREFARATVDDLEETQDRRNRMKSKFRKGGS